MPSIMMHVGWEWKPMAIPMNERWNWRYGGFDMQNIAKVGRIYSNQIRARSGRPNRQHDLVRRDVRMAVVTLTGHSQERCVFRMARKPRLGLKHVLKLMQRTSWFDTGQIANGETYQLGGVEGVVNVNQLVGRRRVHGGHHAANRCNPVSTSMVGTCMSPIGLPMTTHHGIASVVYWAAPSRTKISLLSEPTRVRRAGLGCLADCEDAFPAAISAIRESKVVSVRAFSLRPQLVVEPLCPYAVQLHQWFDQPKKHERPVAADLVAINRPA